MSKNLPHSERRFRNVCVSMPVELHEALKKVADQRGLAVSALVREIVHDSQLKPQKFKANGWFLK